MTRDSRDLVAGLVLVVAGLAFAFYTITYYDLGTMRRMGPGMMPAALGFILAFLGALIVIPALRRPGGMPEIRVRSPLFVLLGLGAFAALIRTAGLVPAIVAATVISSFADTRFRPASVVVLTVGLCVAAWLVFNLALGLAIPMFRSPF